jgi:N-acetylneuraminic acid mutarotase
LYDPISGTWTNTGSLNTARANHTATLLPNGKVLVAGGNNASRLSSSEVYDPATGTWTNTGSLNTARYFHTATLLPNNKVLVAGGSGSSSGINTFLASSEVYDPASGSWTTTASLNTAREYHTATLLNNGVVLVTGGYNSGLSLASTELYVVSSAPLCIGLSSNLVTVWWPNAPGWVLQQNSDLTNPNGWSASSGVTNTNGTNYLNLANPSNNLFFRLH